MVVLRGDEVAIEEMVQSRAWKLFVDRAIAAAEIVQEEALDDKVIPEQARYALLGQLKAFSVVLGLPEILIDEARAKK